MKTGSQTATMTPSYLPDYHPDLAEMYSNLDLVMYEGLLRYVDLDETFKPYKKRYCPRVPDTWSWASKLNK